MKVKGAEHCFVLTGSWDEHSLKVGAELER